MTQRRMAAPRAPADGYLIALLASLDDRDKKDALQAICEALEAGLQLRLENNLQLARLLAEQRNSKDETVRRWFYKYVGLARNAAYLPVLLERASKEDAQTATWIIGAVCAILGLDKGTRELRARGVSEELLSNARIFYTYFAPNDSESRTVVDVVSSSSDLLRRWASFLHVRVRDPLLSEYTRDLNRSDDPELSEFSVWSVGRATGRFADSGLDPNGIATLPPQVRRWAYHLVAADSEARDAYADLMYLGREYEPEERVREGLATGLARAKLKGAWLGFADEWARNETSTRVQRALAKVNTSSALERTGQVIVSASGRRGRRLKGQVTMFGVPKIESSTREMVYFLAIDTVKYSEAPDSDQLSMVSAFLEALANDVTMLSLPPEGALPLFTGDGIIIGVRGSDHARKPLQVALELQRKVGALYKFQLRIGVHCGSAFVLSMSDGRPQLIGHAINEAARVMAGAAPDGVTMSDSYYAEVLHRGREAVPGYELHPRSVEDKHGNSIPCYDVMLKV